MAFLLLGLHCKIRTNKVSLLMERADNHNDNAHVIDIGSVDNAFSSVSIHERPSGNLEQQHREDQPSTSSRVPGYQPSLFSNSRNSSLNRREDTRARTRRPLNSPLWISVELVLTVGQIIAAIVVLCLSKNEKPIAPLKAWIIGYASGCAVIVPLLCCRFRYRNHGSEHATHELHQDSARGSQNGGPLTRRVTGGEDRETTDTAGTPSNGSLFLRLKAIIEYSRMALDGFFAVWFVIGNVWVFGGHSSAAEAPHVYSLCIAFLTISCVGYAMPFILCTAICCCLPCIISLGLREDLSENRGATQDSINSLPTYKFKVKKRRNGKDKENRSGAGEGGIVAAGTAKERAISAEDAVCCICLAKYTNNDELRELPCSHLFHKECVDKWLKVNASCPLCKAEVGQTALSFLPQQPAGW